MNFQTGNIPSATGQQRGQGCQFLFVEEMVVIALSIANAHSCYLPKDVYIKKRIWIDMHWLLGKQFIFSSGK